MQQRIAKDVLADLCMFESKHKVSCSWMDLGTCIDLYLDACRKYNYVDFDRLLTLLVAMMRHAPGVVDKYARRYRCVRQHVGIRCYV